MPTVKQSTIEEAVRSATIGGKTMMARLLSGDPEIIFAAALANFMLAVLKHEPKATVFEVKEALLIYARARTTKVQ